jgi:hypothetical protein
MRVAIAVFPRIQFNRDNFPNGSTTLRFVFTESGNNLGPFRINHLDAT